MKSRETIDASVKEYAAEKRRSEDVHPEADELAAYHEGELAEEARERIREHLAFCGECSRLVLDLASFSELEPPSEEYRLSEEDVEAGKQALRDRIRDEEGMGRPRARVLEFTPRPEPEAVEAEQRPSIPAWYHAVAATLLAATVGLALWSLRGPAAGPGATPSSDVNQLVVTLLPSDDNFRGSSSAEAFPDDPSGDLILMLTFLEEVSYPAYRVEIHDEDAGQLAGTLDGLVRRPTGHFTLAFPSELRGPGKSFRLELFGLGADGPEPLAQYLFALEEKSDRESP